MTWEKIGGLVVVVLGGIWLESKLTGTSVNLNIINPQKTAVANPPASKATNHPSAQKGAAGG
jgi:hypothetical protein